MGGMTFMNCSLDSMDLDGKTIGDCERMVIALNEMNKAVEEGAEEAKGGSGHVAKALFSYGSDRVGVVVYVPEALKVAWVLASSMVLLRFTE